MAVETFLPARASVLAVTILCAASALCQAPREAPGEPSLGKRQVAQPEASLSPVPLGLTLPVQLAPTLHAGSTPVGTALKAYTTQRVPVSATTYLPRGTEICGVLVGSQRANRALGQPAILTLRFTSLRHDHQEIAFAAHTVAIANFTDVADTFAPINDIADRGEPSPANWTTQQVGGDELSRSGWIGVLESATMQRVGFADFHGIYADPNRAGELPHALGVFSADASGLYGFSPDTHLSFSGADTIVTAPKGLVLRGGDNLLLEVGPPASAQADATAARP